MKRTFDIVLSFILMLFFFIPALTIAIVIKLTSEGQVIYWSKRVGKNNIIFNMPKFRTMKNDTPELASHLLQNSDTTLTSIGGYLRKYSLDEIPQLWNVLKGEMSLVGPRPERPEFDLSLNLDIPYWNFRTLVKPGLTGWAQIRFDYASNIESSEEKLAYDLYYIKNASFFLDMEIILSTLRSINKGSR